MLLNSKQPMHELLKSRLRAWLSCPDDFANQWIDSLCVTMHRWEINSPARISAFLAHAFHESCGLKELEENLSYNAARLRVIFPKHFPNDASANSYARDPVRIANKVYADRLGNGRENTGDGWLYRGVAFFSLPVALTIAIAGRHWILT